MKRIIALIVIMVGCLLAFVACNNPDNNSDNYSDNYSEGIAFTSNGNGSCYVSGIGTCTDAEVLIPPSYKGDKVTGIGQFAFRDCSSLESIVIPAGVTSIGYQAFYSCRNLTSITFGGTEDEWNAISKGSKWNAATGNYVVYFAVSNGLAFTECEGGYAVTGIGTCTDTDVRIPATHNGQPVVAIGDFAFAYCENLTSVTVPDGVTHIGRAAFRACTNLSSVHVPESVTSIGANAFSYCSALESIVLPKNVASIDSEAFIACTSLASITFEGTVQEWSSVSKGSNWAHNVPATQVRCSDSVVSLS